MRPAWVVALLLSLLAAAAAPLATASLQPGQVGQEAAGRHLQADNSERERRPRRDEDRVRRPRGSPAEPSAPGSSPAPTPPPEEPRVRRNRREEDRERRPRGDPSPPTGPADPPPSPPKPPTPTPTPPPPTGPPPGPGPSDPRGPGDDCNDDDDCYDDYGDVNVCGGGGTCVECTLDSDCRDSRDNCDVATGTCGRCRTNADCTDQPFTGPICVFSDSSGGDGPRFGCQECAFDADCAGQRLALSSGNEICSEFRRCIECESDADCSNGAVNRPLCNSQNICVQCSNDEDCASSPFGAVCDGENNRCGPSIQACTDDAYCTLTNTPAPWAKPFCRVENGQCKVCRPGFNEDCDGDDYGSVCEPGDDGGNCRFCLPGTNEGCSGDDVCPSIGGKCFPRCFASEDCSDYSLQEESFSNGGACNVDTGICVECLTTADCSADDPLGRVCNTEVFRCFGCNEDNDCPVPDTFGRTDREFCNETICSVCRIDEHCTADPNRPFCTDRECVTCSDDQFCQDRSLGQFCFRGDCLECTLDEECEGNPNGPVCVRGFNTGFCAESDPNRDY